MGRKKLRVRGRDGGVGGVADKSLVSSDISSGGTATATSNRDAAVHTAVEISKEDMVDVAYWRRLVPFLNVQGAAAQAAMNSSDAKEAYFATKRKRVAAGMGVASGAQVEFVANLPNYRQKIKEEGYFSVPPSECMWARTESEKEPNLIKQLAKAAKILKEHGWPCTFLAMYDEAWDLAQDCQAWMSTQLTEGNNHKFCMDVVGFFVEDGTGFSPHRDRQPEDWQPKGHKPEDPKTTFDPNGFARYLTMWVALTDATPDASCLHYVNAKVDSGYWEGDTTDGDLMAVVSASNKDVFQHIRACPVQAGGFCCHTHRVIHWGNQGERDSTSSSSSSSTTTREPRIAISFAFSNNDTISFEPPYLADADKQLPFPRVELRAALCCAQVLNYSMLSVGDPAGWATLAGKMLKRKHLGKLYAVFQRQEVGFAEHYRKEIAGKFVSVAMDTGCSPGNGKVVTPVPKAKSCVVEVESPALSTVGGVQKTEVEPKGSTDSLEGNGDESEADLEDEALEAMLEADGGDGGDVLFHDDFDVLAAQGMFGLVPKGGRVGGKKGKRRRQGEGDGGEVRKVKKRRKHAKIA